MNKKNGDTSIKSKVEKCLKIDSEELKFLPCMICSNCRNKIVKCEDPSEYPIRVKYADLIENVKANAIENEECICEICLLGSTNVGHGGGKKTHHQSHFLINDEINVGGRPSTKRKQPSIIDYYDESKESTKKQKIENIIEHTDKGQAHHMFSQILYLRIYHFFKKKIIFFYFSIKYNFCI